LGCSIRLKSRCTIDGSLGRRSARPVDFGAPTFGSLRRRTPDGGVSFSTCWSTFSFVNTGRPGDKLMTASPFFEHGMHSTEWGRKTHRETAPKTGLRAQLARGFHLTLGSLRVLATEPRLMALPFLALVFTGFVWLIVVLSVLALGLAGVAVERLPVPGDVRRVSGDVFPLCILHGGNHRRRR